MKMTLFALCLFFTTSAFAQYTSSISSQPNIYESPSHPAHAAYAPMLQEQNVLSGANYSSGQGDRRASDFPQPEGVSLGAAARELKKQRVETKKTHVVWINQ